MSYTLKPKDIASKAFALFFLLAFCYLVTAASHFAFFSKWALRDNQPRFSFKVMIDETAERPFVYRQLLPMLSRSASRILPNSIKDRFIRAIPLPNVVYGHAISADMEGYRFHYRFLFLMSFLGLFLSQLLLRQVLLKLGFNKLESIAAPALFVLIWPIFQTVGGYYYDAPEIMFFSAAFLLAMEGHWLSLILLSIPATLNKESFLFFAVSLFPLLRRTLSPKTAFLAVAASVFCSAIVNVVLKLMYAGNVGGMIKVHLIKNIKTYINPFTYFYSELTYGIKLPRGVSFLFVLFAAYLVLNGWQHISDAVQKHILFAVALNLPLFLLFCYPEELRNLSMLYPAMTVLLAGSLNRLNQAGVHSVNT